MSNLFITLEASESLETYEKVCPHYRGTNHRIWIHPPLITKKALWLFLIYQILQRITECVTPFVFYKTFFYNPGHALVFVNPFTTGLTHYRVVEGLNFLITSLYIYIARTCWTWRNVLLPLVVSESWTNDTIIIILRHFRADIWYS